MPTQEKIEKVPYKAFIGEENLYKVNEQGRYIIPTEFIVGALEENGAIYENEKYRGNCADATIPNEADFSESTMRAYNKSLAERQEECELFLQAKKEVEHPIKSRIEKFIAFFQRKNKTLALPEKTQIEPRKTICEKVEEPDLGDRTRYLSQSNEQSIEKEEEK